VTIPREMVGVGEIRSSSSPCTPDIALPAPARKAAPPPAPATKNLSESGQVYDVVRDHAA